MTRPNAPADSSPSPGVGLSANFTAGPWYVSGPFAGFGSIKQAETDELIFGIARGDPDEAQPVEVCEANAALIAAAPALYEALKICLAMGERQLKGAMNLNGETPYEIGLAALKLARGEP